MIRKRIVFGSLRTWAIAFSALVFAPAGCKSQNFGGPAPLVDGQQTGNTVPGPDATGATSEGEGAPSGSSVAGNTGQVEPPAAAGHPRLWLQAADLPRLRAWAATPGAMYSIGLRQVAERAKVDMDKNDEPFNQASCADATGSYACEAYAELFAFMSLVSPSDTERAAYGARAKTALMKVIREAAKGKDEKIRDDSLAIRSPGFSTGDRSRWNGEGFALTVDWIYPLLSPDEKATIRKVFLRWCDEDVNSSVTTSDHPEPRGVINSPALVKDPKAVRFSSNNYFTAHMRNIGLMAMALDPKDDPGNKLRAFLKNATGAWLYMVDFLLNHDARGGIGPEGYEYGPQTLSYVVQFLLALETAGEVKPERWGPQVNLAKNVFWDDALTAYFHMESPGTVPHPDMGPVYQPIWMGDGQRYWAPDFIDMFGPLGILAARTGNEKRASMARYIQRNYPPGGANWSDRLRREDIFRRAIFYFLLFDPAAKIEDPRRAVPLAFFAPGLGHFFARTSWGPEATAFHYNLGWMTIDHQHADGNNFDLYRRGEWLTKRRVGYGDNIAATDSHNSLALENSKPDHNGEGDYRYPLWKRGSQWIQGENNGDGKILAQKDTPTWYYALGDATNLYNSDYETSSDIVQASRSIVWLKPDHIVIYDRATSKTDKRFKRFLLQVPTVAAVAGNVATMTTPRGQKLFVTKLLPENGVLTSAMADPLKEEVAEMEPMRAQIKTEVPGGPKDVRFLHVLQGSDGAMDVPALVQSRAGAAFDGTVVKGIAVLFPRALGQTVSEIVYAVPPTTRSHLVTGLTANGGYTVSVVPGPSETQVTIKSAGKGGERKADDGGVLAF